MTDDDELCLCFHVTRRKVIQYIRIHQPKRASELTQCFGAGSGCGWCRRFLRQLLESESPDSERLPAPDEYSRQRTEYRVEDNP